MENILEITDEELDARCRPVALSTAAALLRGLPREDAEECANDVMLRLLSHREGYDPARASLETYVRVMARSEALTRRRRAGPQLLPLEEELYLTDGPEEYIGDILEAVLDGLREQERALFTLRFLYGLDGKETARRLGMSRGAVDVAVARLRSKLKKLLAAQGITLAEKGAKPWKSGT